MGYVKLFGKQTFIYYLCIFIYGLDVTNCEWCSFVVQGMDRSITSGVSAAGTLALLQHLLSVEPKPDWISSCPLPQSGLHWPSFTAGIFCGCILFALIQAFTTLRWLLVGLFQSYLDSKDPCRGKVHYRFLDEPSR